MLTRILSLRCGYLNSQVAILMQLLEEADIPDPSAGIINVAGFTVEHAAQFIPLLYIQISLYKRVRWHRAYTLCYAGKPSIQTSFFVVF